MEHICIQLLLILTTLCSNTVAVGFNESCTVNADCTESDPNTKCSGDSVCVCKDNYVYVTDKCISILNVTVSPPPRIKIGEAVTISCVFNGQPTATNIQWKRNDSLLDISNTARYSAGTVSTPSLTIKNVTRSDAGSYQCLATNDAGTGESNKVTLTTMDRQFGDSCGDDLPCDDSKDLQCVNNKCECKNTHFPNNNVCYDRKQLNEACNSVMLCVNEPQVTCNGGVCVCNTGYYDDNGQTTGGSCQTRKQLNEACDSVMLCVNEPQVKCNGSVCVCNTGYYDDNGQTTGGSCQANRQFGDSCGGDLPCDDSKVLQCVNNKCECKNTHYPDNNVCYDRKQLNEACNSVMLCVNEPQVTCNGGVCVCNTGYYDDNGLASGGSCKARKNLGDSCTTTVLCLENIECATDNKCRCPDNFYDDNKNNPNGTCKDINELKVTAFTLTASTNAIVVTWTLPTAHTYVSRYDVRWRITGTGSAYSTTSVGTANTLTINYGLMAGQVYDVFIESVDTYTQVVEQKIASDTNVVRLKPNPPGSITNPSAPKINLMWTASPNSVVSKYMVMVVEVNATEKTTTSTPSLTVNTALVPGMNYTMKITAVSGTPSGAGGETYSVAHEERIRTMVEKPSPPVNVKCPMNPKDRSLEITWSAPDHPNGIIQYYRVYVYYSNGASKEEINTTGAVTTFNVQNLTPESTFGFAVSAVNDGDESIRTSDMTTRIYCTTKAALSTMPQNLAVSNIESRNFTVTFNQPATPKGRLIGYVLFVYQEEKSPQKCVQKILFRCSDCGNNYTFIQPNQTCSGREVYQDVSNLPDTPSISYMVIDLLPYMDYTVEAAGINNAGEGNLATLQNFIKTGQEEPNKPTITAVTDIGQTQIKLQWNITGPRPGPTNITVTVYEVIGNTRSVNKTVLFESAFNRSDYILMNLEEYWDYQFTVTAATVIGSVTSDMSAVYRTLPTAPGKVLYLTVVKAYPNKYTAVQVSWKIPPLHQRNSYLDKYIIVQNFTSGSNNNVEIPVNLNQEIHIQMFRVTPETYYSVEVYAKNNESSNSDGEKSHMIYYAPPGPPKLTTVQSVVTTAAGGEQAQTTTFVVELNINSFIDNTNGRVEYYGLAVCRRDKYIDLTVQQDAFSDEWINLPNYQTAKDQGYPLYRVTDGRFIQRVIQIMSLGRRKRSTTFQYTIGSETCANNTYYCNGPLSPGTSFNVMVFICTAGGCSHSGPLGPYNTKTIPPEEGPPIGIIVGVLAAVVAVTVVVIVFIVVRHRRRLKKLHKRTENTYTDLAIRNINPTQSRDEAYTSLQIRTIRRNRPIPVTNFLVQKMELEADSKRLLAIEFNDLTSLSVSVPCTKASHVINRHKNRSSSIIPSDSKRLKLGEKSDTTEDYINASLIQIPLMSDNFECIATQHPLPETTSDFWQMVWERNVSFIIMLNSVSECESVQYWPIEEGGSKSYGAFSVKVVACFSYGDKSVHRMFEVSKGKKVKNIKQLHFENWRTFSKRDVNPMLDFLETMETNIEKSKTRTSTVIHCSDGSGRTGVYICVHILVSLIKKGASKVDVFDTAHRLLQSRKNIIETEEQYHFIYECLGTFITKRSKGGGSMPRQSIQYNSIQRYATANDKDVYEQLP